MQFKIQKLLRSYAMTLRTTLMMGLAATGLLASSYTVTPINVCAGCTAAGFGVNNSGVVAGVVFDAAGGHSYFGTPGSWTIFDVPGSDFNEAVSINDAGVIGGDMFSGGALRVFRREPDGTINTLPLIPGYAHMGGGQLNNTGLTVGNVANDIFNGPAYGFIVNGGSVTAPVEYPGAHITQLSYVNDFGVIAGYYQTTLADLPRGFVRQADGTLVPFDVPGAAGTQLYAINNLGHIAGGYYEPDGTSHGFIYANGQFTTIDFTGPNTMIWSLNDLDQVVGASYPEGGFFTGPYSGFLATPVPEPSSVSLSAAALGALFWYAGRRRCSGMK
jgi:hypothetical protein